MKVGFFYCLLFFSLLLGCSGSNEDAIDPKILSLDVSNYKAAWDDEEDGELFTKYSLMALEKHGEVLLDPKFELVEGGFKRYCVRYNELSREERKVFWIQLISGLSFFESGFDPSKKYEENFTFKGKPVVSRGLMQMSIGSVNNKFYDCQVEKESDLHKPGVNLTCAVKIMNYWVGKDSRLYGRKKYKEGGEDKVRWLGLARYWSPVRYEAKRGRQKDKYDKFHARLNALEVCKTD